MRKILFPLIVLLVIVGLLFINYGGFYLLQGTWICENVTTGLVDIGASRDMFPLGAVIGRSVSLRFTLGEVYFAVLGYGETMYPYLAQTGRLIVGDWALRYQIRDKQLVLSNTSGEQLVFVKQE